jgi:hypothetical protein
MSTSSRRVLAVTVAAIVAVLTGILAGLLGAQTSCTPRVVAGPAQAPAATTASNAAGLGGSGSVTQPLRPAPTGQAAQSQVVTTCDRDRFEAIPALAAVGGALLAGALVLVLVGLGPRPAPASPRVPAPRPAGGPPAPGGDSTRRRLEADREALVRACIYVRDRLTSKALADRLGSALREVGVSAVEPAGERFDPSHHEAGGAAPSKDPEKVGRIAAVEVPGYSDRGRVLRPPVVTVYQPAEPGGTGGSPRRSRHADREER